VKEVAPTRADSFQILVLQTGKTVSSASIFAYGKFNKSAGEVDRDVGLTRLTHFCFA
ncbi:Unknown protein, partial [Striga hermonthica]